MKIVFIGDIVGRSGREALSKYLPQIKKDFTPDIIIANSDIAAVVFGLTDNIS